MALRSAICTPRNASSSFGRRARAMSRRCARRSRLKPPTTLSSAAAARWRRCAKSWSRVAYRRMPSTGSRRRPGSTSAPSRRKKSRCRYWPKSPSSGAEVSAPARPLRGRTKNRNSTPCKVRNPPMQMSDSQRIPASKEKVWAALNDPAILKQCIPGCEALDMSSPTEMTATVVFRVGPVKATFGGKVTLSDLDPPNSYRISGEGSGGVAGFAKGGAAVRLDSESPDVTILHYEVDAQIGGKLAQLGQRLIDSTAQELAGEVFASFGEVVGGEVEGPAKAEAGRTSWIGNLTGRAL